MNKREIINKIRNVEGLTKDEKNYLVNIVNYSKQYGLVWENKPENVEEELKTKLPILKEIKERAIINDTETENYLNHILIEGDNLHTLTTLTFTHEEKVDVIYIDPPYNTGSRDWKYNNDYVDKEDDFKHSKWLSFMSKRLEIAKRLLKPRGVLICTIDENEVNTLGLLLSEIFMYHKITLVSIVHNPSGIQGKNFSNNNEFAFFVYPNGERAINQEVRNEDTVDVRGFMNGAKGNSKNYLRESGNNCFYPIIIEKEEILEIGDICDINYHPESSNIKKENGKIEIYPIDLDGVERKWLFARDSVDSIIDDLSVKFNKKRNLYEIIRTKKNINYKTVWTDAKYNAKTYGTLLIKDILGKEFPFPKSLYAVKECIKACIHPKNGIVLDFFAGSGTTMHAVIQLNSEDGGNRQCILATNNENNIAYEICYQRNKKVIEGYVNGKNNFTIGYKNNNLRYYKCEFVERQPTIQNKIELTRLATELLCIKEECYYEITSELNSEKWNKLFSNRKNLYTYVSYSDLQIETAVNDLTKFIESKNEKIKIKVYVFSHGQYPYTEDFENILDSVELCALPDVIYKAYQNVLPKIEKL